ncbi:hypothetical protein [Streptomyces sp. NPDC050856]|uniref:hypothetical protein n=1 Tax=Streptomyces sp. NPDC050856 TaxID=3154939 RepID=UPI003405FA51
MTLDAARVISGAPIGSSRYFGSDEYAVTSHVRWALRMADGISPGAGVDVVLYGKSAEGTSADRDIAVRTRVEPESLEEWAGEWATISDTGGLSFLFLEDRCPAHSRGEGVRGRWLPRPAALP